MVFSLLFFQRKIFEYGSPAKMKIVKLSAKQESESEDEVAATTPKGLEHDSG